MSDFLSRAKLGNYLLVPAAGLYALGWLAYEFLYRSGIRRPSAPHHPIICVGNLRVGGMGKTPLTMAIAKLFQDSGRQVIVSTSGYRSKHESKAAIAPDGRLDASDWGDESALIREALPHVPLIVGRDRRLAAELASTRYPKAIMVMDDGFQHLPLEKDFTIVIEPAERCNPFCLPAGPYREPRSGLRRCDFRIDNLNDYLDVMYSLEPQRNLEGQIVQLLTSIARPERLRKALMEDLKVEQILREDARPDHDPLASGVLTQFDQTLPLVVTMKDWVKLRDRSEVIEWDIVVLKQQANLRDSELKIALMEVADRYLA
jgi:tetraacyldisaccharide 4'-kinase